MNDLAFVTPKVSQFESSVKFRWTLPLILFAVVAVAFLVRSYKIQT